MPTLPTDLPTPIQGQAQALASKNGAASSFHLGNVSLPFPLQRSWPHHPGAPFSLTLSWLPDTSIPASAPNQACTPPSSLSLQTKASGAH